LKIHSILENPRYLVLTEDNQQIYNNSDIFKTIYNNNNKLTLPNNSKFKIIFTSRNIHKKSLSEAFKSRCTIIYCPSYKEKKYMTMNLNPSDNYEKILKKNLSTIPQLGKEIENFRINYKEDIEFLSFIRLCKTAKNIFETSNNNLYVYKKEGINYRHIVGIGVLRSIFDKYNTEERILKIKYYLKDFLPKELFNLLVNGLIIDNDNNELPFEVHEDKENSKIFVKSKYSGISIKVKNIKRENIQGKIIWTNSSIDIADAFLTSLASNTILILEGPPGRGKTIITKYIYEYLDIKYERINFSPSTKKEEIFSRVVPIIEKEKIITKNLPQKLLKILEESKGTKEYFEYGLLLDEMNLSKEDLREDLYSYLGTIKNKEIYTASDEKKYTNIGNIAITITMNGSVMSNSRTSLSDSFLNLSHSFKLQNYTKEEIEQLIKEKLKNYDLMDIKHVISQYNKYSNENKNNTFREIMKIQKYFNNIKDIGLNELLDMILFPEKKVSVKDWDLRLDRNNLYFGKKNNYIKFPFPKNRNNRNEIKTLFTSSQKEALMKILVGIKAESTILLTGEINSGKTYLIEQLAYLMGIKLKIIQFTKETNSSDLIGKLKLTKQDISDLQEKLKRIMENLINKEFEDITKFIKFNKNMDVNGLKNILQNIVFEKNKNIDIDSLKKELDNISILNNINFDFIYSTLINAMKNGEWVLLDDIHFAKAEIERLMSLLEEEPELTIYEKEDNIIFKKSKNDDKNGKLIDPHFRLFMTSSNDKIISSAVKSRCLHINLKKFKESEDYAILISNYLINSELDEENIIQISKIIANSFSNIKNQEEIGNYILRNYKLSSMNLVHFSKLIQKNNNINGKNISNFLKYSIFSGIKKEKKEKIMNSFINALNLDNKIDLYLIPNIKKSHEFYLSQIEKDIISYYCKSKYSKNTKKEDIIKDINKEIENINTKIKRESNLSIDMINWDINEDLIIEDIKKFDFTKNLSSFTFREIEIYYDEIKEVFDILKKLIGKFNNIFSSLYFLKYLLDILEVILPKNIGENNSYYHNKIEDVYNIKNNNTIKIEKLYYFKNMIEGFKSIFPEKTNFLELDKSIISLFYQYYYNSFNKDNNKIINIYFSMLPISQLKNVLKHFEIKFPNTKNYINEIFNILTSSGHDIQIDNEIDNIKIIITKKIMNLKEIDNNFKQWNLLLTNDLKIENNPKEETINHLDKNDYFIKGYDYLSKFYEDIKDENDIIKNYWYYHFYLLKEKKFKNEDIKKIISPEIYYFIEGITYILENDSEGNWQKIKNNIILGFKFFEGIREINEKNKISLKDGFDLFKSKDMEINIEKILNIYQGLNKFFNEKNAEEKWKSIKKEIEEKIKIVENENIKLIRNNKKKKYEKEYHIYLETFKDISDYESLISENKKEIELLINHIDDIKFEEKFNSEIYNLKNKIEEIKRQIKKKKEEENNQNYKSEILSKISNKNSSDHVKILHKYYRLRAIIEEMQLNKNEDKSLNDKFNIIIWDELEGKSKDLYSFQRNYKEKSDKIKFYESTANFFLITKIILNKNSISNENIVANKLIEYFMNLFEFKEEIEDLGTKFKDNEFLYIPELKTEDINQYFILKYDQNFHLNLNFKDILDIELDKLDNNKIDIEEFKIYGLPDIKIFVEGMKKVISYIQSEDWINKFVWLKQSYDELKNDSWKKPNQLLIKKKHGLHYDNIKNIYDGKKVEIKYLFAYYESKKPGKTKKWKSLSQIQIQNISQIMKKNNKNYEYGYRIMELYDFTLYRDNISESMLIIIETIDRLLKEKLGKNLSESIIKIIINRFYEELIIDKIAKEEIPDCSNLRIIKIFQYLLYNLCLSYEGIYMEELNTLKQKINNQKLNLKNIIIEITKKSKNILIENNLEYEKKIKIYNENIKEEKEKAKNEFSKNYPIEYFNFDIEFEKSKEYQNYIQIKNNYTMPKKDSLEKNKINLKMLEKAEKEINEINKKENFEELKKAIKKINIQHLDIIDLTRYKQYKELNENIIKNIEEFYKIEEINKKLNIKDIINLIPNDIKNDNFVKPDEFKNLLKKGELIETIENLREYNFNIFEIQLFKENIYNNQDNYNIYKYIDKIKESFLESNLNFIFIKDQKPFFLNCNMKINLGIYVMMDNMTNNIGNLRIKNNAKEDIKYELTQISNNNIIQTNINKGIKRLKKYEDLEIKFILLEKTEGKKKANFDLILLNQGLQNSNKCSIEVFIYVIPLIIKFSINKESFIYNKNYNDNTIKINHHIKNFEISYKLPGCDPNKGPKVGFHLKTISKEKIGINNEENGKISIINNFENGDNVKYNLSLYLLNINVLNFEIFYEKSKYYGLLMFDNYEYYIGKDNCLGEVKILKGDEKDLYIYNMTTQESKEININIDADKNGDKIEVKYEKNIKNIEPGKMYNIKIINNNIGSGEYNLIINEDKYIHIMSLKYPKIIKDKDKIYCSFDEKNKEEITKKFKIFIINREFKLYKKDVDDISDYCFSAFLIFKNGIVDKIYEEGNYIYEAINKDISAYGFYDNKFLESKPDKMDIILKQKNKSIFTSKQREEFNKKINNKYNFIEKIKSKELNDINYAINYMFEQNEDKKINLVNYDMDELSKFEVTNEQTCIKNIIIYLMKLYINKSTQDMKKHLMNIYKSMYKCERKINPYFTPDLSLEENIKSFIEKLGYIISFVTLCVSPGELLENEINEDIIYEINNEIDKKQNGLDEHFRNYFKNNIKISEQNENNNIYNDDFIYFENKIYPKEKKDLFVKYEEEINKKTNEKYDYKTNEQNFECSLEMENDMINKIIKNEINCFNLLIYLKMFEKYIISIPYIFSKEERRKDCISNSQKIYDFMSLLKKSNIYKETEFNFIIDNYFNEIEYLLSNFTCFKISKIKREDNFEFNFVQKCILPVDEKCSIADLEETKINEGKVIAENKELVPLEQKIFEDSFDNYNQNKSNKSRNNNRHFRGIVDNQIYEGGRDKRIIDVPANRGENMHKGYIPKTNDESDSDYDEDKNEENKNNNDIGFNNEIIINDIEPPLENYKIQSAKYEMKNGKVPNNKKEKTFTSEKMLELILNNIESNKEDKIDARFGSIRNEEELNECIYKIDDSIDFKNKNFPDCFIKCSNIMKNIIMNIIRKRIINFVKEEIYTLENSYIDLTIDISQMMSEQQRIASLIIAIGLSKSLVMYGVNIRISVFGENDNIWLLYDKFENNNDNINKQLYRLRDALASKKRYQSFPADALVKLNQNFRIKKLVGNYVQILISSLISPQVIDEMINWEDINVKRIIVFGLRTHFEDNFLKSLKEDINNLLNLNYRKDKKSRSINVSQKMFDPYDINKSNLKEGEKSFKILIEDLIKELLSNKESNDNILKRGIAVFKNKTHSERDERGVFEGWIKDFHKYLQNEKGNKFFAQSKEVNFNKSSNIFEKLDNNNFPSIEELNELSNKNYSEKNFLEDMIKFEKEYFNSCLNNYFEDNFASGKIFCSSGGIISIRGLKKWISSGFVNTKIFERKGPDDSKKYIITFIFDISKYAYIINSTHVILTILIMLLAPSIIESNEEILIDIIINTNNGIKIIDYNSRSEDYKKSDKLYEIVNLIISNVSKSCSPGSCLFSAFKLLSERKEEEKIFLLTDNFITDKYELELLHDLLGRLESSDIELITIGVGDYPYGLDNLYPKCCYTQSFSKLKECLLICFNDKINESSEKSIIPAMIIQEELSDNEFQELSKYILAPPIDKILEESINSQDLYIYNMILKDDSMFRIGNISTIVVDPDKDLYSNGVFKKLKTTSRILLVLLYYGESNKDSGIYEEIFNRDDDKEKGAGSVLKMKGLEYTIVYNYQDAINELTIDENGHCKYLETWIFCSDGSGDYPKGGKSIYDSDNKERRGFKREVTKNDNEKELIPFLETVAEFNKKGGALLLFCDNEPFTFEANLLLSKYLKFDEINKEGANFKMGGNYVRKSGMDPNIYVREDIGPKNASFPSMNLLPPPGNKDAKRFSLRVGIEFFNEGITLSYAKAKDNSNNYEPFIPFAYLTDEQKEKPFILYYDPIIDPLKQYNRGPIVVHGGFTSAFYEFTNKGTGKLIISIACWLGRIEELIDNTIGKEGYEFFVPKINKSISNELYKDWYQMKSIYSIFILDVSGSMKAHYDSLIETTNKILKIQKDNEESEIVLIFFGKDAKEIKKSKNKFEVKREDIDKIKTDDTKYNEAFKLAKESAERMIISKEFILTRLLFFTDGGNHDDLQKKEENKVIIKEFKEMNFKLHFFGFGDKNQFSELEGYKPDSLFIEEDLNKFDNILKSIERQFTT